MTSNAEDVNEPQDGGCRGWLVVVGAFICSTLVFGLYPSIGPLLVAIQQYFEANSVSTSSILSLILVLQFGLGPLANLCVKKVGFRTTVMCGAVLSTSGFILSSFAPNIEFLFFSLGVLVGLGYGMTLAPGIGIVASFIKKRFVLAHSLVVFGGGFGIFIFPPLLQMCIDDYGWRGSAIVFSSINAHIGVAAALFGPRNLKKTEKSIDIDAEETNDRSQSTKIAQVLEVCDCTIFVKFPGFIALCATSFTAIGLGLLGAPAHLVARAVDQNIGTPGEIALMNSLLGIASMLGRLTPSVVPCCAWKHLSCCCVYGLAYCLGGTTLILSALAKTYVSYAVFTSIAGYSMGLCYTLFGVVLKGIVSAELFVPGIGLGTIFTALGGLLGPICAGYIYDVTGDYNYSFYFYGSFVLLGGTIMLAYACWTSRQQQHSANLQDTIEAPRLHSDVHLTYVISSGRVEMDNFVGTQTGREAKLGI